MIIWSALIGSVLLAVSLKDLSCAVLLGCFERTLNNRLDETRSVSWNSHTAVCLRINTGL